MQATTVASLIAKTSSSAAPAADANQAAEGADFSSLLAAQLLGGENLVLPFASVDELPLDELPLDELSLDSEVQVPDSAGVQDLLRDMLLDPLRQIAAPNLPSVSEATPFVAPESEDAVRFGAKPDTLALPEDAVGFGAKPDTLSSVLSGLPEAAVSDAGGPQRVILPLQEKAAEIAAGKSELPLVTGDKTVEGLKQTIPDAFRMPDSVPAAVSGMPDGNRVAGVESKTVIAQIQVPVGHSDWGDALGEKVVWMAGQQQQVAELRLNPPNLGPLEVRLTVSNDQVSAVFVSHQPAVREAIESAMPRLREMFADSGMMLSDAMVSSDSFPQQQNAERERRSSLAQPDFPLLESAPVVAHGVLPLTGYGRSMVDFFA